jgi:hypothetical protein
MKVRDLRNYYYPDTEIWSPVGLLGQKLSCVALTLFLYRPLELDISQSAQASPILLSGWQVAELKETEIFQAYGAGRVAQVIECLA